MLARPSAAGLIALPGPGPQWQLFYRRVGEQACADPSAKRKLVRISNALAWVRASRNVRYNWHVASYHRAVVLDLSTSTYSCSANILRTWHTQLLLLRPPLPRFPKAKHRPREP
ncbi:uncharacterized protein MYCFIDRAFT_178580 [Pseudocercospora fijiensis CIRAD86]|uniref:Uncharacterized protein n=1 Tax=Pseudocercospora fijiensis (strain CIRAD86) TaxID=383855 RepID=M2ZH22_PSEFD|nr:uncharacterized protein MYCFIDRAFT_178580 [Pseudocercospora fijiensis CIRAD86]EME78444.1 hypothetical protein MYCFIDRAFT_178580 [Pseudocercospora fijiensis CIRAD86]